MWTHPHISCSPQTLNTLIRSTCTYVLPSCVSSVLQTETVPVLFDDILLFNYNWLCTNDYLVPCDMVLIYCKQWLLLSWMLTFSWFSFDMSRDLWDRFIEDRASSCPVWWSSSIRKTSTTEEGRSTYKSSLIFTHIVYRCVMLSCPYFQEGLCVCKRDGLPSNHHWYSLTLYRCVMLSCP